jgi:hypothetical protein
MKHHDTSRQLSARSKHGSSPGGLALLEHEISGLREENVRLQRRLEEIEMTAELRVRANRILAIRPQEER